MQVQQTLGDRYKLLNELGRGGMAVVWRARDEVLGRSVAVKLLAQGLAGDPVSRARIRDEARAAAALSHPNIAQVYDYGESGEAAYVVMELIDGPTLQQRTASGPLPPRTVFRICGDVAAALAAAHADGLVHRDIKMANVMVTPAGAKVVDFGIAAAAGPAVPDEMLVGTPAYLAPERLAGGAVEPASDVYALGVLLFRLLADEAPWSVETTTQMLNAHVYLEPEPLPPLPGVPPAVTDLVARCLRKTPAARPSAVEVSAILGEAAIGDAVVGDAAIGDAAIGDAAIGDAAIGDADLGDAGEAAVAQDPIRVRAGPSAPVAAGRLGAVGDDGNPVPNRKQKALLAGGGVGAVLIAVLVGWWVFGTDAGGEWAGEVAAPVSVRPVRSGFGAAPVRRAGNGVPMPSAAERGRRPPVAGAPPRPSASATASAGVSTSATATPSPPASASSSASPTGTELTSPGGTVYAECATGEARLTAWEPAAGFTVQEVEAGPALIPEIVFEGDQDRYRMSVTCVAGRPTPVVLPL